MHLEVFSEGTSVLHRLDPRVKIILAFLFTSVVAISRVFTAPLAAFVLSLILFLACRLNVRHLLSRFAILNFFFLFLLLVLPFSVPGDKVFSLGSLTATREGFAAALLIMLKGNAIYGAIIALLSTSSVIDLGHALHHLRVPGKLVQLFFFTFRYISVLHDEYERIKRALKVRSFTPRTSMHTYRTYAYVVGVLFLNSYDRAVRIYRAMVMRGFDGTFRTLHHFSMKREDFVWGFVGTVTAAAIALIQVVVR